MGHWTVGKRIVVGFSLVVLVVTGFAGISYWKLHIIDNEAHTLLIDCVPGQQAAGKIEATIKENYLATLKHVMAATAAEKSAVEEEMKAITGNVSKVFADYDATITLPEDRVMFNNIIDLRKKFLAVRNETILPVSRSSTMPEAVAAMRSQLDPVYATLLASARKLWRGTKATPTVSSIRWTTPLMPRWSSRKLEWH